MFYVTSNIDEDLKKARTTSKPTVFLGGVCDDKNKWREELKKEFGGSIFFIDPYDKNWKPEKNIYNELTGIVNSEYAVFYKGGDGTEKEKDFIDSTGVADYKEFDDMDKLRGFLRSLSKTMRKSAADVLRSVAAKLNVTYDHCSTQVDLPEGLAKSVIEWGKNKIPEDVLHNDGKDTKGREDQIHSTILYGLTEDDPEEVKKVVSKVDPFSVRLGLITAFMDKPDYDVLKIDAESPQLIKLHYMLRNKLKNDNKYPTYSPHISICYLKKGKAKSYIGDDTFRNKSFFVHEITYSNKDNKKIKISLGDK